MPHQPTRHENLTIMSRLHDMSTSVRAHQIIVSCQLPRDRNSQTRLHQLFLKHYYMAVSRTQPHVLFAIMPRKQATSDIIFCDPKGSLPLVIYGGDTTALTRGYTTQSWSNISTWLHDATIAFKRHVRCYPTGVDSIHYNDRIVDERSSFRC